MGETLELLIYLCSYSGNLGSRWSSLETPHLICCSKLFLENPVRQPAAEGVRGFLWPGQRSGLNPHSCGEESSS